MVLGIISYSKTNMNDELFITSMFWLGGSVLLLWRTSILAIRHGTIAPFLAFFSSVMVMDTTAAFIYYGSWMVGVWTVIRLLWLGVFVIFLATWLPLVRSNRDPRPPLSTPQQ